MDKKQILPLSLKKNFSWTLIGNIFYAASQWLILIMIAKMGTVEMVGQYALALAISTPIFLFLNMQLRSVLATDLEDQYSFNEYLSLRGISSIFCLIIIFILLLLSDYTLQTKIIIFIVSVSKFVESISDIFHGLNQKNERMDNTGLSLIVKGLLSVILFGCVFFFTEDFNLSLLGITLAWGAVLLLVDLPNGLSLLRKHSRNNKQNFLNLIRFRITFKVLKKIVLLASPLGIVGTLDTLTQNIPRYFIEFYISTEALGYYSSIVYLMIVGGTVVGALANSAQPKLASLYLKDLNKYSELTTKLLLIGAVIGFTGLFISTLFGETLLRIIYSEQYSEYNTILILVMFCALFWYLASFLNSSLIAARMFKLLMPVYILTALATFISSIILIKEYELIGATLSLCIGMLIRFFLSLVFFRIVVINKTSKKLK